MATTERKITESRVRESQRPVRALYRKDPAEAWIVDRATTRTLTRGDPFHAETELGTRARLTTPIGVHAAVGGPHDLPVPGDLLCAALATCLDSTTRMIADRMGIELALLEVEVRAHVDVRGTLAMDPEVPVGFQRMECRMILDGGDAPREALDMLVDAAERYCVVYQTLRGGVPLELTVVRPE